MQKITFQTKNGEISFSDADCGAMDGQWRRLWLNDFDGNSLSQNADAVQCLDLPGQRTLSTIAGVRTITAKLGFAPLLRENGELICTGEKGKHLLRREVLRHFPLGEEGILVYSNDIGIWNISVRVNESPKISYTTRLWAEATVYLTADFPFWKYPITESEEITIPAGTGEILSERWGDMESPVEILITAVDTVPASAQTFKIYCGSASGYWYGVNCEQDIPSGTILKYDIGTNGEMMCYRYNSGAWETAPQYWAFRGNERKVCNGTSATAFRIMTLGTVKMKIIYHNLAAAV